jgi:hypothetical protein
LSSLTLASDRPVVAGKYLVSPLTRMLENGSFGCSVSIRSGSGQGTTDRIVSLTRLFRDRFAAAAYARAEGMRWIASRVRPATS